MNFYKTRLTVSVIITMTAISSSAQKLDSLEQLLTNASDTAKAKIYVEIADYYYSSDISQYRSYLDSALMVVDKKNDASIWGKILHYYGDYYDRVGSYDSAIMFYDESITADGLGGDLIGAAKGVSSIGLIHYKAGRYDQASKYFFESLEKAEKINHQETVAVCYGYLGHLNHAQKKFSDALLYHKKAKKIHADLGDLSRVSSSSVNIGNAYHQMQNYDSALFFHNTALQYYIDTKDTLSQSYPYNNMALVYNDQKKHKKSIEYLEKGLAIRLKYNEPRGVSFGYNFIGLNYQEMGEYEKAIEQYEKAVEVAVPIDYVLLLKSSYEGLAACFDSLRNYHQAYRYQKKMSVLSDTLFNRQKIQELTQAQTKYETEKKEQQIASQNLIISEEKARNQRNVAVIIGLVLSFMLLVFVVLLLRNRMRRKQELALQQKDLEYKELQLGAVIDSQEKERRRFATDLHDGFGQLISILKLNVESVHTQVDRDKRQTLYDKSINILNEMYGELRNICFNLMPQSLVKFGLIPSLQEFAEKINASEKLIVEVLVFDMDERLAELQEISIYRIVQEWVNNIMKYSDATKVTIQLTKDEGEITLTVEDDGMGFELTKLTEGKGNGWKNIRSRTNLIHGDVEIDTTVGKKGNMLIINVPIGVEVKSLTEVQSV